MRGGAGSTTSGARIAERRRRFAPALAVLAALLTFAAPAGAEQGDADRRGAASPTPPPPAGVSVARAGERFTPMSAPLETRKLYDVSVTDYDADGNLDLFSTGHKYRGSLLAGNGDGTFADRLDDSRLSATANAPGFDQLYDRPTVFADGIYLYVDEAGRTIIRTRGLGSGLLLPFRQVNGRISYAGRNVKVISSRGVTFSKRQAGRNTEIRFTARDNAAAVLRANFMDLPFEVTIDQPYPLLRTFLGPRMDTPSQRTTRIDLGDRHGVAWGDLTGDSRIDAYIANGGERGKIDSFRGIAQDELYVGDGAARFRDDITGARIDKGRCRGRYAAPVDYDDDGDLDLFVGCEGTRPLLYAQGPRGQFSSRSALLKRVRGDQYRWLEADGRKVPELLAIRDRRIDVYAFDRPSGGFERFQKLPARAQGLNATCIATGDPDRDGDVDAFVCSRGANTLLTNKGGEFEIGNPRDVGLPARNSVSASFVDVDNDGRLDLHTVPQGIFRQKPKGGFVTNGVLRVQQRVRFSTANWFDADNDGYRDLVASINAGAPASRLLSLRNVPNGNHWLEVELRGPAGNEQAIGAKVSVTTADGRTQSGWVGDAEGSRYSTGHYRLYFGLGRAESVKRVVVRWPLGKRTRVGPISADRLLRVGPSTGR